MKKTLIALAMFGAFAGTAVAQSNVTLYGILDVNYQRNDPNGPGSSVNAINSGHQSGSRWGLRGTEALGRGMNAIFTVEGGYGVDDGQLGQGGRLWGRQAWAGLNFTGANVSLVAGRLATLSSGTGSFDMFGAVDPFLTGFGDSSLGSTFSSIGGLTRADNTIALVGGPWAGFRAGAIYSFNIAGQESGLGSSANNRLWGVAANYSGGPFFASITYDVIDPTNQTALLAGAPGVDDETHLQIGGTFDLKFVKLHAGYAMEENLRQFATGNSGFYGTGAIIPAGFNGRDADAWMVGVTVPLLGGSLLASYQDRDGDTITLPTATGTVTTDPDVKVWAIGYSYPFSRRTNVYASFSNREGKGTNENQCNTAGTNTTYNVNGCVDRKQYTVGVRHLF